MVKNLCWIVFCLYEQLEKGHILWYNMSAKNYLPQEEHNGQVA